jgi:hypothetical protein
MADLPFPRSLVYESWGYRTLKGSPDYHRGTDFGRGIANVAGTPVPCVADGVVTAVGSNPSYQHFVEIEHARDSDGRRWWTRHHMLSGAGAPARGQRVLARQIIGQIAPAGGVTTGVHHHFELHTDDASFWTPLYSTSVNAEDNIQRVPVTGSATSPNPETGDDMYDASARAELYDQIANDARPIRLYTVGSGIHAMGPGGKSEIITNRSYVDLLIAMRLAGPATPLWTDAQFQWAKSISGRLNPDPQVNAAFASVLALQPEEAADLARGLENTTSVPVLSRAQVTALAEAAVSGDDARVHGLDFVTVLD